MATPSTTMSTTSKSSGLDDVGLVHEIEKFAKVVNSMAEGQQADFISLLKTREHGKTRRVEIRKREKTKQLEIRKREETRQLEIREEAKRRQDGRLQENNTEDAPRNRLQKAPFQIEELGSTTNSSVWKGLLEKGRLHKTLPSSGTPEKWQRDFEQRWGLGANEKLTELRADLSGLKSYKGKKEWSLQEALEPILQKFLTENDGVAVHDTSLSCVGLQGRKPDFCTTRKEDAICGFRIQGILEAKIKGLNPDHLGQAYSAARITLETQPWRNSIRCLVINCTHVCVIEVSLDPGNMPIHQRTNVNQWPSSVLGSKEGVLLIDNFLHQTPVVCTMPLDFVDASGSPTSINLERDAVAFSGLLTGTDTVVYRIKQKESLYLIKSRISDEQSRPRAQRLFQNELEALKALRPVSGVVRLAGYHEQTHSLLFPDLGTPLATSTDTGRMIQFRKVLGALKTIHESYGYLHRDIQPANIICSGSSGFVLVSFGLAVHVERNGGVATSSLVGAIMYAPQEHILDAASDSLEYSPSTDLQSFAKTVLACVLTDQAKAQLTSLAADKQFRALHDTWETLLDMFPIARKLYGYAKRTNYDGFQAVLQGMSTCLFASSPDAGTD